jgi:hypothetical protein
MCLAPLRAGNRPRGGLTSREASPLDAGRSLERLVPLNPRADVLEVVALTGGQE